MSRTINRALLSQIAARQKVALESDEVTGTDPVVEPAVPPVEGAAETTPAAVAAATGEQGVADPAAPAPAAPTVIIKVEVEQASKPADPAVVTDVPADDVAPTGGDAASAAATDAAAGEADAAVAAAAAEVPAAATADVPGDTSVPPADAGAELPAEPSGEVDAAAPAGDAGEAAPTDPAAAAPAAGAEEPAAATAAPAEGGEAAVPPVDAGSADNAALPEEAAADTAEAPAVTDDQVDAKPTEAETDAAAAEVADAIAAAKGDEEEGKAAAATSTEELGAPEVEAAGNADAVENALPQIDEVELVAAQDPAPEIETIANEIDGYQGGAETMDKIADVLAEAAEEGGLNESGAKVLEVAVEHICNQLGLGKQIGILSMECFAEPGTRVSSTTIAMEAISGSAAEAWKTVMAALTEWLGKIADFYNKIASGALLQEKRAQAVLAAVAKLGDKSAEGSISSPTLAKSLARGNSVSKNVAQELLTLNKVAAAALQHGGALAASLSGLTSSEDIGAAKEALAKAVTQHVAAVMKPDQNLSDVGVADAPEGTQGYATLPMLGNVVLWAYAPKSGEALGRLNFGRHVVAVENIAGELPVLNTAQIKALATIVVNMSKSMAELRKMQGTVKTALAAFNAYANKAGGENAKPDPAVSHAVRQLSSGLLMHATKAAWMANSDALAYCSASLKKLGAGEEAAPAAAAPAAAA